MFCRGITESATETQCVEPGHDDRPLTVRCSRDHLIVTRRATYYARLPVSSAGFCDRPSVDAGGGRGDCVPHADVDRDRVAGSCNARETCELATASGRAGVVSACSNVTGQVYFTVEFDCISRESPPPPPHPAPASAASASARIASTVLDAGCCYLLHTSERQFSGTKILGNECSESESTEERKVPVPYLHA